MALALVTALLLPYFAWGLYTLDRRYRHREDWSVTVEAVTLTVLALYFALAISFLGGSFRQNQIAHMFSILGLFVSAFALYGHMAVSLASKVIVEIVAPSGEGPSDTPRLGPAEALERQHDYEGAYNEYLVLARMYPGNPTVLLRLADNAAALENHEDALRWYERACKHLNSVDQKLAAVSRACDLCTQKLNDSARAASMLHQFLRQHPDGEEHALAKKRLDALGKPKAAPKPKTSLDALNDEAVEVPEPEPPAPAKRSEIGLLAMEDAPASVNAPKPKPKAVKPIASTVAPIDAPIEEAPEPAPSRPKSKLAPSGLQALDENPMEEDVDDTPLPKSGPGIGLESRPIDEQD